MAAVTWTLTDSPGGSGNWILSNGNLTAKSPNTGNATTTGSAPGINWVYGSVAFPTGQKTYIEYTVTGAATYTAFELGFGTLNTSPNFGITYINSTSYVVNPVTTGLASYNLGIAIGNNNGQFVLYNPQGNAAGNATPNQWANGDTIAVAMDRQSNPQTATWYHNNVLQATLNINGSGSSALFPMAISWNGAGPQAVINGGANGTRYTPPSGYTALDKVGVSPPGGGEAAITVVVNGGSNVTAGTAYNVVATATTNSFHAATDLQVSGDTTAQGISYGPIVPTLSSGNTVATFSGLLSSSTVQHTASVIDNYYGVTSSPVTYNVVAAAGSSTTTVGVTDNSIKFSPNFWYQSGSNNRPISTSATTTFTGQSFIIQLATVAASGASLVINGTSTNPLWVDYSVNGTYTRYQTSSGSVTISGLVPSVANTIQVFYSFDNYLETEWTVTGYTIDNQGTTKGAAIMPQPNLIWYGDSITYGEGVNGITLGYAWLVTNALKYACANSSVVGSGWLRPGETPWGALYPVATPPPRRWNTIDYVGGTTQVPLLDSNNQISSYGATGTTPFMILVNLGTNEAIHGGYTDAQIVTSVTNFWTAARAACGTTTLLVCCIPFGLYDSTIFATGPQIITDIKAGITAANAAGANVQTIDLGANVSTNLQSAGYTIDTIHMNQAGNAYIAGLVQTAVSNIIAQNQVVTTPPGGTGNQTGNPGGTSPTGVQGLPYYGWGLQWLVPAPGRNTTPQTTWFIQNFCVPRTLLFYPGTWNGPAALYYNINHGAPYWLQDPAINGSLTGKKIIPISGVLSYALDGVALGNSGVTWANVTAGLIDSYIVGNISNWWTSGWKVTFVRWGWEDNYTTTPASGNASPGSNYAIYANGTDSPGGATGSAKASTAWQVYGLSGWNAAFVPQFRHASVVYRNAAKAAGVTNYTCWGPCNINSSTATDVQGYYPDFNLSDGHGNTVDSSGFDWYFDGFYTSENGDLYPNYNTQQPYTKFTGAVNQASDSNLKPGGNDGFAPNGQVINSLGSLYFYSDYRDNHFWSSAPSLTNQSRGWNSQGSLILSIAQGSTWNVPEFGTANSGPGLVLTDISQYSGAANSTANITWVGAYFRSRMNWFTNKAANGYGSGICLQISYWDNQGQNSIHAMGVAYPEFASFKNNNPDAGLGSSTGGSGPFMYIGQIGSAIINASVSVIVSVNYVPTVSNLKYSLILVGGSDNFVALPGGAAYSSTSSTVNFTVTAPGTPGNYQITVEDTSNSTSTFPQTILVAIPTPANASITLPQIPPQNANVSWTVQIGFNGYVPIQANIQIAHGVTGQTSFAPTQTNTAANPTWSDNGQILSFTIQDGLTVQHSTQIQDITFSPPLQSAVILNDNDAGTATGAGGTITVSGVVIATGGLQPAFTINAPGTQTEVSPGAGVTVPFTVYAPNIGSSLLWRVVESNGTPETSYTSAAINSSSNATFSALMLHNQDYIGLTNVAGNTSTTTHTWTATAGLNTSAFNFTNGNKTVGSPQVSVNTWVAVWANGVIPSGQKTYFEVTVVGTKTGTASGVGIGWVQGGFIAGDTTQLNNPAYQFSLGYNGSQAYNIAGASTTINNPRQWPNTSAPPGFQSTPGSGLEQFTYQDSSGNIREGYATINTSLPQANGNTSAWVPWGGATGIPTVVGVLVDLVNFQVTTQWKLPSTGYTQSNGPFNIPSAVYANPLTPVCGCQTGFLLPEGISFTMNGGTTAFVMPLPAGYSPYDGGNTSAGTVTGQSSPVTIVEVGNTTPTMSVSAPGILQQVAGNNGVQATETITTTNYTGTIYYQVFSSGNVGYGSQQSVAVGATIPASVASISAHAALTYTGTSTYTYTITLFNNGNTSIGTFWFAWIPGQNFLVADPTPSNPSGWTNTVTGGAGAYGIQWTTSSAPLAAGNSLQFTFTSTDTPAYLAGLATSNNAYSATTSTVYVGAPSVGAAATFTVLQAEPTQVAVTFFATGDYLKAQNAATSPTLTASSSAVTITASTAQKSLAVSSPGTQQEPSTATSVTYNATITSTGYTTGATVYWGVNTASGTIEGTVQAAVLSASGSVVVAATLQKTGDYVFVQDTATVGSGTVTGQSAPVTIVPVGTITGTQSLSITAPGQIMEASMGAGVTPSFVVTTTGVTGGIVYRVRTSSGAQETSEITLLPTSTGPTGPGSVGAAITVPASPTVQQQAGQAFTIQAGFNYVPNQANVQVCASTATPVTWVPIAQAGGVAFDGTGQLMSVTYTFGSQVPHTFGVRDVTNTTTPLTSAFVTIPVGSSGGGGIISVPTPTPAGGGSSGGAGTFQFSQLMLVTGDYIQVTAAGAPPTVSGQAGVAYITYSGSGPYTYVIHVLNNGTANIGTFWFAWQPGQNYLTSAPTVVPTSGWVGTVVSSSGYSIQWVALTPIVPNASVSFSFTSADTPATLFGYNSTYTTTLNVTSATYAAAPSVGTAGLVIPTDNDLYGVTIKSSAVLITDSPGGNYITVSAPGTLNAPAAGAAVTPTLTVNVSGFSGNVFAEVLTATGAVESGYVTYAIPSGWTSSFSDTFSRANTTPGGAGSTTGAGNGWIDVAGGVAQITSDELVMTTATHNEVDFVMRPFGEALLNSRITAAFIYETSGMSEALVVLRANSSTAPTNYYQARCYTPSGFNDNSIQIFANSTQLATSGANTLVNGTNYTLDFQVTGSNPTTLSLVLANTSTGAQIANLVATDSTPALQDAGSQGLVTWTAPGNTDAVTFTGITVYSGAGGTLTITPPMLASGDYVKIVDNISSPTFTALSSPVVIIEPANNNTPAITVTVTSITPNPNQMSGYIAQITVNAVTLASLVVYYQVMTSTNAIEAPYVALPLNQNSGTVSGGGAGGYSGQVVVNIPFNNSGDSIQFVDNTTAPVDLVTTGPLIPPVVIPATVTVTQPTQLNAGLQTISGVIGATGTPPSVIWLYWASGVTTIPQVDVSSGVQASIVQTSSPETFYAALTITGIGINGGLYYNTNGANTGWTLAWTGTPLGGAVVVTVDSFPSPLPPQTAIVLTGTITNAGTPLVVCLRTAGAAQPVQGNPDVVVATVSPNPNPNAPAGVWTATVVTGAAGIAENFWVSTGGGAFSILTTVTPTPSIIINQPVQQVATVPYTVMVDFGYIINIPQGGPVPNTLVYSETGGAPFFPVTSAPGGVQVTTNAQGNSRLIIHLNDPIPTNVNLVVNDQAPPGGGSTVPSNVVQYVIAVKPTSTGSPFIFAYNPLAQQQNVAFTAVADFNYLVSSLSSIKVSYDPSGTFYAATGLPLGAILQPNPNITGGTRIVFTLSVSTTGNAISFQVEDTSPLGSGNGIFSQQQFFAVLPYAVPTPPPTETRFIKWTDGSQTNIIKPQGVGIVSEGWIGGTGPTTATSIVLWTPPQTTPGRPVTLTGTFTGGPPTSLDYSLNGNTGPWITALAGNVGINANTFTYDVVLPSGIASATNFLAAGVGVRDTNNHAAVGYTAGRWVVSTFYPTLPSAGTFIYGCDPSNPNYTTTNVMGQVTALHDIGGTARLLTAAPTTPPSTLGGNFSGVNAINLQRLTGADNGQTGLGMSPTINSAAFDNTSNYFDAGLLGGPNDALIQLTNTSNVQNNNFSVTFGCYLNVNQKYQGGPIWGQWVNSSSQISFLTAGRWNGGSGTGPFTSEIAVLPNLIFPPQTTLSANAYMVVTCQQTGTTFQWRINKGAWQQASVTGTYAFNPTNFGYGGSFITASPNVSDGNPFQELFAAVFYRGVPGASDISSAETWVGNTMGLNI